VLAELIKDADPKQYAILLPKFQEHRERALALFSAELTKTAAFDWKDPPLDPAWSVPDPALVRQLESAHGLLAERFALCQALPQEQFVAVAEGLRRSGYRPIRLRPYRVGKEVHVAAVWNRDGRDWQMVWNLPAKEILERDADARAKGWIALDV